MMFNDVCIIMYTFLTHSIPILWSLLDAFARDAFTSRSMLVSTTVDPLGGHPIVEIHGT